MVFPTGHDSYYDTAYFIHETEMHGGPFGQVTKLSQIPQGNDLPATPRPHKNPLSLRCFHLHPCVSVSVLASESASLNSFSHTFLTNVGLQGTMNPYGAGSAGRLGAVMGDPGHPVAG